MYPVVPSNSTRAHWLQLIVISSLSHKYHLISLELSITDHIKRCFLKFFKLIVPPAGEISGFHLCLPTSTLLTAQQLTYIRVPTPLAHSTLQTKLSLPSLITPKYILVVFNQTSFQPRHRFSVNQCMAAPSPQEFFISQVEDWILSIATECSHL
jgi:hypothetical protein